MCRGHGKCVPVALDNYGRSATYVTGTCTLPYSLSQYIASNVKWTWTCTSSGIAVKMALRMATSRDRGAVGFQARENAHVTNHAQSRHLTQCRLHCKLESCFQFTTFYWLVRINIKIIQSNVFISHTMDLDVVRGLVWHHKLCQTD